MKISDFTKKILENFATINHGLVIRASENGPTKIQTASPSKDVIATAIVPETLPFVSLYDLGQLLSVMSSLKNKDPDLTFDATSVTLTDGGSNVKILFADPALIIQPSEKGYPKTKVTLTFDLPEDSLSKILTGSKILNLPHLRIFNDGEKVVLQATDRKNPNSNTYQIVVGENYTADPFEYFLDATLLKMIPGDYTVEVGVAVWFTNKVNTDLVYIVGLLGKK